MRISDWSSDVCSSDLLRLGDQAEALQHAEQLAMPERLTGRRKTDTLRRRLQQIVRGVSLQQSGLLVIAVAVNHAVRMTERAAGVHGIDRGVDARILARRHAGRSEEHTSELQSLMRISYAVFCLKKKKTLTKHAL